MKHYLFLFLLLLSYSTIQGQVSDKLHFLETPDSLHKGRFWTAAIGGGLAYTGMMIGLNEAWYSEFPRSEFHFFNDAKEWEYMDKVGHFMTTYFESNWSYAAAKWTGIPKRKAMWLGAGLGLLYQSSIEAFDGFSSKWGFSVYDMAANTLGAGFFVAQELYWEEQRIVLKFSSIPPTYKEQVFIDQFGNPQSLQARVDDLYGSSLPERILKDYNGQTLWASFNIRSFTNNENSKIPGWLNIAIGYGANNMFGGFANEWEINEEGDFFRIPEGTLERYSQFYLSPDIDLSRIKTKSHLLKTLLFLANAIKVPLPAVGIDSRGKVGAWWLR